MKSIGNVKIPRRVIFVIIFLVPLLVFFSMSCDIDSTTEPKTETLYLTKTSGDNQEAVHGDTLSASLTVLVTDEKGYALSGRRIDFRIISGGGSLSDSVVVTDDTGKAETTLILGDQEGEVKVGAAVYGTEYSVVFTTKSLPQPTVIVTSPNGGEQWSVGTSQNITWTSQYVNMVKIEYSCDRGTTWTAITGSVDASLGRYEWIVPDTPSDTCLLRISDASNTTITDQCESVFTIIQPFFLTIISGDNQQGVQGDTLSTALTILVTDKDGKAVSDKKVDFTIKEGEGTLSVVSINTDENGRASTILTLGNQQGKITVEAKISGTNISTTFTAIVGIHKPYSIEIAGGDGQVACPGETLHEPLQVLVKDDRGRPFEGAVVTFSIDEGTGSLSALSDTTTVSGTAHTLFTLGDSFYTTIIASLHGADTPSTVTFTVSIHYVLTLNVNQPEAGRTNPTTGTYYYAPNDVVTIKAIPEEGYYRFVSWTGDVADVNSASTTVKMTGDKTVTANFERIQYTLTMAVNRADWGTVSPEVGSHIYDSGTLINFIATPAPGYIFVNWTRTIPSWIIKGQVYTDSIADASTETIMFSDLTMTANFEKIQYSIEIVSGDGQQASFGNMLSNPLVIIVNNQQGKPLEGIPVQFSISVGEGTLTVIEDTTSENGFAKTFLTVGNTRGSINVIATIPEFDSSVTFEVFCVILAEEYFPLVVGASWERIRTATETDFSYSITETITGTADFNETGGPVEVYVLSTSCDNWGWKDRIDKSFIYLYGTYYVPSGGDWKKYTRIDNNTIYSTNSYAPESMPVFDFNKPAGETLVLYRGISQYPPSASSLNNSQTLYGKYVGLQSVTVPAGTFSNCAVFELIDDVEFTEDFTRTEKIVSTYYFAKGVGEVKRVIIGTFNYEGKKIEYVDTEELTYYNIPGGATGGISD